MTTKNDDELLGVAYSSANHRLRKLILFDLLQRFGLDQCFRCGQQIEDVDDLSVDHMVPWRSADQPTRAFFDLDNVAFSHLGCNTGAYWREKTHCPQGPSLR